MRKVRRAIEEAPIVRRTETVWGVQSALVCGSISYVSNAISTRANHAWYVLDIALPLFLMLLHTVCSMTFVPYARPTLNDLQSCPLHIPTAPTITPQLMKFTQKKCSNNDASTKSANALSCEIVSNSALFSLFVWMRSDAVRTNWPTQALKPERKALKGCARYSQHPS